MSDRMRPIPFENLMNWALTEYAREGSLFGVHALYRHKEGKTLPLFGEALETPVGPAAGPHTQLAQNIISAYAAGARFFELKTVQVIDGEDLPVSKPCILAADEGYNVEWSTELRVEEALGEYVKAWFALKLLSRELDLGSPDGFLFNMSVGYDLAGIKTPKIDAFIEGLKNAEATSAWAECFAWTRANPDRFKAVDEAYLSQITPRICSSITLSTLHGCPPEEIERIATYLITQKKLNTFVKCNPTLLGYEFARKILDSMGYDYLVFDDHHFKSDLQYEDAVPMFRRLMALAEKEGLAFGVKLTNTFPVTIARGELPGSEMYMSGKSLYPLTIALAGKLSDTFEGKLRISYSGGADAFNIAKIFAAGIWPITVATTLLKPGGYNRLAQMARELSAMPYAPFLETDCAALRQLAGEAKTDAHHVKPIKIREIKKIQGSPPLTDCFAAGCETGCPIGQDIPAYLKLNGEGKYAEALSVICEKNPLPFITGTICTHRCQSSCVRNFCEEPVKIRSAKLLAAEKGYDAFLGALKAGEPRGEKVAVVGGGPGGMAAAFFLARAGASVTVFEQKGSLGGIVRHVIPEFRIGGDAIDKDVSLLKKLGVELRLNTRVDTAEALFARGFTHVIVACGAWKPGRLALSEGTAVNVLDFLENLKKDPANVTLGRCVAVVGGGNSAVDAARAAKRVPGVQKVMLLYRRTRRQMPADAEELELAVADGVIFRELVTPISLLNSVLTCNVMELGAPDESGRGRPSPTGEQVRLPVDTLIAAVGEEVDSDFLDRFGVPLDDHGRPTCLCAADRLYVIGDAFRGPATVVKAIAEATRVVKEILGVRPADAPYEETAEVLRSRRGILRHPEGECDSGRCLGCERLCELCVEVCPNRANLTVRVPGSPREQVVHVDRLCNECGNCKVFCPYGGAPYRDKLTVFASRTDFIHSENQGFLPLGEGKFLLRLGVDIFTAELDDRRVPRDIADLISVVTEQYAHCL